LKEMGNALTNCMPAQTISNVAKEDSEKPYSQFRSAAVKAVTKAAHCAAHIQSALVSEDVLIKKDKSPVTIADLASQIILISELTQAFPQVPFIAEESSRGLTDEVKFRLMEYLPKYLPEITPEQIPILLDKGHADIAGSTFYWTIDPIDGTEGYLRREQYAVCLALLENFVPVLGVLGCPALPTRLSSPDHIGCLLVAVKGQGRHLAD
jgi:3'-phosphoadenosine 5'-phosphosulfate (PAPS) 3'-phosphatase